MADQEHGAGVIGQQVFQQIECVDVQVVGGLVQHQHIAGFGEQARQQQTVALATAEGANGRIGTGRREQEVLQIAHHVLACTVDFDPLAARTDEIGQGGVEVQVVTHLVEIGHTEVGTLLDGAAVGLQFAQNHLQQCGLASAVRADQAHLVATQNGAGEVLNDDAATVALADVFQLGHDLAASVTLRHIQLHAADHVTARGAGAAQVVQAFDAGGRACATGFHAPANPHLFLSQQLVELGVGDGLVGQLLGFQAFIGGEVAGVGAQLPPVEFHNARANVVQEGPVVRNQHDGALERHQQLFQPGDGVQVQVVGWLVEHQHIGAGHQGAGQGHALFRATRQAGNLQARVQVQALQGLIDPLFPVPTVARLQEGHQGVEVFALGMGLEAFAGRLDLGQTFAHRAEHRGAIHKGGLLRHVRNLGAALDLQLPVIGLFQPRHDLEQRGFACAVAANQANTLAGFECECGVVEQGHVAIGQAGVAQGQNSHGRESPRKKKAPDNPAQGLIVAAGAERRFPVRQ